MIIIRTSSESDGWNLFFLSKSLNALLFVVFIIKVWPSGILQQEEALCSKKQTNNGYMPAYKLCGLFSCFWEIISVSMVKCTVDSSCGYSLIGPCPSINRRRFPLLTQASPKPQWCGVCETKIQEILLLLTVSVGEYGTC